jgi:outer membrane protein TolC
MSLYEYRDSARKVKLYGSALLPMARQSLEASRTAFQAGKGGFLDVIDAERMLLEFELSYERALAEGGQALARLRMLVGRDNLRAAPPEAGPSTTMGGQ